MVTKKEAMNVLKECYDPEIGISIVDLGLIYDVKVKGNDIYVKMTLTTPGCPLHSFITEDVKQKLKKLKGVEKVDVELVWDPPWTPERMSKQAKKQFGIE